MRLRLRTWASLALLSMVLIGLWLFFRPTGTFQSLTCELHELTHNGQPVIGIEDMAYNERNEQIYLSAYDRRSGNSGGIYTLNKNNTLEKLSLPSSDAQAFWPHGIHLSHQDNQTHLDVIERDLRVTGQQKARISQYRWNAADPKDIQLVKRIEDDLLCSANNLTLGTADVNLAPSYYITRDQQSCDMRQQKWDNVFKPKSSTLVHMQDDNIEVIRDGLSYANGISNSPNQPFYVAETRGKRLIPYEIARRIKISQSGEAIPLPGGPDNLTVTEQGDVVVAIHPNLIRFAAFRAGWGSRVKSRFAIIAPDKNVNTYDVPANIISGATVALKVDKSVYLGGAFDDAIAVCSLPGANHE